MVLYGDNNNWFAAWAFWQFKYHGHQAVQLMNSGRKKWIEGKRPLSTDKPKLTPTTYKAKEPDNPIRAFRNEIFVLLDKKSHNLMDVRSPDEFTGKIIALPGMPEIAQRAGHIPGATNIPWSKAVNEDGTVKSAEELKKLNADAGVDPSKPTVAYCRIGERTPTPGSHSATCWATRT